VTPAPDRPPPRLGADAAEILSELGLPPDLLATAASPIANS
jgi:crotonobetainyl-CoA:carnitine CoA-transferase CaiB-like acyl-CoA transferase